MRGSTTFRIYLKTFWFFSRLDLTRFNFMTGLALGLSYFMKIWLFNSNNFCNWRLSSLIRIGYKASDPPPPPPSKKTKILPTTLSKNLVRRQLNFTTFTWYVLVQWDPRIHGLWNWYTGCPKKKATIQISALIQTTYCSALKSLSLLNYECVKTHSFIHMRHKEKLLIIWNCMHPLKLNRVSCLN